MFRSLLAHGLNIYETDFWDYKAEGICGGQYLSIRVSFTLRYSSFHFSILCLFLYSIFMSPWLKNTKHAYLHIALYKNMIAHSNTAQPRTVAF